MSDSMINMWDAQIKLMNLAEPILNAADRLEQLNAEELSKKMNEIDDMSRLLLVLMDPTINYPQHMKIGMEAMLIQFDTIYSAFNKKYYKETN